MSRLEELSFPSEGGSLWAGMGDYRLVSPDKAHHVLLPYEGEPPHGDSYHRVSIDGHAFPGYAWGCMFAFSADSRYLAFSWMARPFDRKTVVVHLAERKYFVLPDYIHDIRISWPRIEGSEDDTGGEYVFKGSEAWLTF